MRVIKKNCVICGAPLNIAVHDDKTYTGGHYFSFDGFFLPDEYWECDNCYMD